MSPKNQQPQQSQQSAEHSPWTECFQSNPLHRHGNYDTQSPEHNDAILPTRQALSAIYDTNERP